ncbi:ABC transporter [Nemania serpens]|nr:ABC transporter [Nemania serpens]
MAVFSQIMYLSADFHDSADRGDLYMIMSCIGGIPNIIETICFEVLPTAIDLVVATWYLYAKFGPYEGLIIFSTAAAFITLSLRTVSASHKLSRQLWKRRSEESSLRNSSIGRWSTIVAFNQAKREISRYSKALESRVAAWETLFISDIISAAFKSSILLAGQIASILVLIYGVHTNKATAVSPLRFFDSLGETIGRQLADIERLVDILEREPSVTDCEKARALGLKGGSVEFQHVRFSYDGIRDILTDFCLSIPSGSTVAFVGTSGAGKSTIFKLIMRQYDVQSGSIMIDGQNIRDITLRSLRDALGIVEQSPQLFNTSILENVRYGRSTASDEEVYNACKIAAIHDQIMGLSQQYHTCVGEANGQLSGGQIQRLAIARTILKNPQIILLDEATSAVDTETEQHIQKGLSSLCHGRTTFIIAHRLATVTKADIICVVSGGVIIEQGNHRDLVSQGGEYARLWLNQLITDEAA